MSSTRATSLAIALLLLIVGGGLLLGGVLYAESQFRTLPHPAPAHTTTDLDTLRSWMTLHYIARAYGVPEPVLLRAVGIEEVSARHRDLTAVAADRHTTTANVMAEVRAAIREYRSSHPYLPTPRPLPPRLPAGS